MHEIEPYYQWRDYYIASEDKLSPFYRRRYNEMSYTHKIYNYFIHPQWDTIQSETLFCKVLFADYDKQFAVIELIGEWNDAIGNDVMLLRKELIDPMMEAGIYQFALIGENLLNFHASDDSYYEDWYQELAEQDGWIMAINFRPHVIDEMRRARLHDYIHMGERYDGIAWRKVKPFYFHKIADELLFKQLE
jgi:hypothetical protein